MQEKTKEKIINILSRPFKSLPVAIDLPRLASTFEINRVDGSGSRCLFASAGDSVLMNLRSIIGVVSEEMQGRDFASTVRSGFDEHIKTANSEVLPKALDRLLEEVMKGDSSSSIRLLKSCNQATISPAVVEIKFALGVAFLTKDVKGSWKTIINFLEDGNIQVVTRKREQCVKNTFQFQWELQLLYDRADVTCRNITLHVSDLLFAQPLQTGADQAKKAQIKELFAVYAAKQVLDDSDSKSWEFFVGSSPSPSTGPGSKVGPGSGIARPASAGRHEHRVVTYANGDRYEGEVLILENGEVRRDGKGVYTTADGDVYVGEYVSGMRHGQGVYTRKDGSRYEGQFRDGLPNGPGVYVYENGDIYSGTFRNDEFDGHGRWSNIRGDYYEGQFRAGKRHGKGALEAKGNRYEGDWVDDLRDGRGKYRFKNKDVYEGEFSKGRFHGKGTYYFHSTGQTIPALFRAGQPVKSAPNTM
jgi:hypothetical protein